MRLVLIVLAGMFFTSYPTLSQINSTNMLHPLKNQLDFKLNDNEKYILFESSNNVEAGNVIYGLTNKITYHSKFSNYYLDFSYSNFQTKVNLDTISSMLRVDLKQNHHTYGINMDYERDEWNMGMNFQLHFLFLLYKHW